MRLTFDFYWEILKVTISGITSDTALVHGKIFFILDMLLLCPCTLNPNLLAYLLDMLHEVVVGTPGIMLEM